MQNDIFSFDIATILSYGLAGLCFLFIFLAFFLLKREQDQTQPRPQIIQAIYRFMLATFVMAIVVGVFSLPILNSNSNLKKAVNLSESVNKGFQNISTTDSLQIIALKKENELLKSLYLNNESMNSKAEFKESLIDQNKLLSELKQNSRISNSDSSSIVNLQKQIKSNVITLNNTDVLNNSEASLNAYKSYSLLNNKTLLISDKIKKVEKKDLSKKMEELNKIKGEI